MSGVWPQLRIRCLLTYLPIYLSLDVEDVEEHLNPCKFGRQREWGEVLHVAYCKGCADLICHVKR